MITRFFAPSEIPYMAVAGAKLNVYMYKYAYTYDSLLVLGSSFLTHERTLFIYKLTVCFDYYNILNFNNITLLR